MGGVQVGWGGVGKWGEECSVNGGGGGKVQTFSYLLTMEAC